MDRSQPTVEAIRALPRWAQVAFAARCARRVLPLISLAPRELVERVIGIAERAASNARLFEDVRAATADASQAAAEAATPGGAAFHATEAFVAAAAAAAAAENDVRPDGEAGAESDPAGYAFEAAFHATNAINGPNAIGRDLTSSQEVQEAQLDR